MLHPALAQALVTAHLEDLQRAAARRHTVRLVSICRRAEGRADAENGAELPASAPWSLPKRLAVAALWCIRPPGAGDRGNPA
jgi:hypothetical protein